MGFDIRKVRIMQIRTTTAARYTLSQLIPEKLPIDQLCRFTILESSAKVITKSVTAEQIYPIMIPLITKLGMALPQLVTGAVITETVFSWPGIGNYFVKAVQGMDYPIVMAILVLSSSLVILGNLLSDILYCIVDPRIKSMQ